LMRWRLAITYLLALLLASILVSATIGPVYIPLEAVARTLCEAAVGVPHADEGYAEIILEVRLPRIMLGILVGAILASSGAVMQGLFRNPLADPYVLGVSSGACLGAALSMTFLPSMMGIYATPAAAFAGGCTSILLVYGILRLSRARFGSETLLLAGVSVAYLFSAILSLVLWLATQNSHRILVWVLGGLTSADWLKVKLIAPVMLAGLLLIYLFSRDLNALQLGEEVAQSLGVNVKLIQRILPVAVSLIVSAAASFTGAIGFVGLMMPHIMRRVVGPDYRILIPSSALAGAIFLTAADTVARCLMEIPVGVVTALSGVPFFIYLLRRAGGA